MESFVPGTMECLELGWDVLRAWNPNVVFARISGWGQTGPDAERPGFGTLMEAASGFAAMNGEPDGAPIVPSVPLADMTAALYAVNAILVALYHREHHDGHGQVIDVSLFESLFSILGPLPAEHAAFGRVRTRAGSRSRNSSPRGCYATREGAWLAVSGSTPKMAERFLTAYGLDALLRDPRFATNEARVRHNLDLDAAVAAAIAARTLDENLAIVRAHALTAVPVQTVADIERDPHWRARHLLVDVATDHGTVRMHDVVPRLSESPGRIRRPGVGLGHDNASVYADLLGLTPDTIADLTTRGVL
jgi:crotonobetainyl-CoA:carnitine CoA-transferase CaiB-like acyl-CoA transferase